MALIKDVLTQYGIDASYHKLIRAEFLFDDHYARLTFAMYANEESRAAGHMPLQQSVVTLPISQFDGDPRDMLYRIATDYGGSQYRDAEPDVEVAGESAFPVKPFNAVEPTPAPEPVFGGPEAVPGAVPATDGGN
jgi:hypothetical protein